MHPTIAEYSLAKVRQRLSEGDCPTTPAHPVEHLEDLVVHLANRYSDGWQPIETAPKDGTRVLLWGNGFLVMIGAWLEHTGMAYLQPTWWSNGVPIVPPPTHWQHLPSAPAA